MAKLELYGTARCPHTQEMRDWLEFRRCDFVEYDVENDGDAVVLSMRNKVCKVLRVSPQASP